MQKNASSSWRGHFNPSAQEYKKVHKKKKKGGGVKEVKQPQPLPSGRKIAEVDTARVPK